MDYKLNIKMVKNSNEINKAYNKFYGDEASFNKHQLRIKKSLRKKGKSEIQYNQSPEKKLWAVENDEDDVDHIENQNSVEFMALPEHEES